MSYTEPLGDEWKYNPEYNRIADFLGIDMYKRDNLDVAKKISTLRDYLDIGGKPKNITEILSRLDHLKRGLGIQTQGETLVQELFQHARLDMDRRQAEAIAPKEESPEPVVIKSMPEPVKDKDEH